VIYPEKLILDYAQHLHRRIDQNEETLHRYRWTLAWLTRGTVNRLIINQAKDHLKELASRAHEFEGVTVTYIDGLPHFSIRVEIFG